MRFRLRAEDVTFDAENIDDAFRVLADYFRRLGDVGLDGGPALLETGSLTIFCCDDRKDVYDERP